MPSSPRFQACVGFNTCSWNIPLHRLLPNEGPPVSGSFPCASDGTSHQSWGTWRNACGKRVDIEKGTEGNPEKHNGSVAHRFPFLLQQIQMWEEETFWFTVSLGMVTDYELIRSFGILSTPEASLLSGMNMIQLSSFSTLSPMRGAILPVSHLHLHQCTPQPMQAAVLFALL